MHGNVEILIGGDNAETIVLPLKTAGGTVTHIGVLAPKDAVGWSRLYMHLWNQGRKTGLTDEDDIESWVLGALELIRAKSARITPDNIAFGHVIDILVESTFITRAQAVIYDAGVRDTAHDDEWFWKSEKYGKYFTRSIKELAGGFTGWWLPVADAKAFGFAPIMNGRPVDAQLMTGDEYGRDHVRPGWCYPDWTGIMPTNENREALRGVLLSFVDRLRCPIELQPGERIVPGDDDLFMSRTQASDGIGHRALDIGSRITDGKRLYSRCKAPVHPVVAGGIVRVSADGVPEQRVAVAYQEIRLVVHFRYKNVAPAPVLTRAWMPVTLGQAIGTLTGGEGGWPAFDWRISSTEVPCTNAKRAESPLIKGMHVALHVEGVFDPSLLPAAQNQYIASLKRLGKPMDSAMVTYLDQMKYHYNELLFPKLIGKK